MVPERRFDHHDVDFFTVELPTFLIFSLAVRAEEKVRPEAVDDLVVSKDGTRQQFEESQSVLGDAIDASIDQETDFLEALAHPNHVLSWVKTTRVHLHQQFVSEPVFHKAKDVAEHL